MSISFSQLPTINAQYAAWQDAGNMITYFNNLTNWNLVDNSNSNLIKGNMAARTAARDALVAYYTAQQAALVVSLSTLGVIP